MVPKATDQRLSMGVLSTRMDAMGDEIRQTQTVVAKLVDGFGEITATTRVLAAGDQQLVTRVASVETDLRTLQTQIVAFTRENDQAHGSLTLKLTSDVQNAVDRALRETRGLEKEIQTKDSQTTRDAQLFRQAIYVMIASSAFGIFGTILSVVLNILINR